MENSQLLVLVEFPHLTYNQSEHEAYTVTERLNFLMLKCAKYSKTFPHLSITEQFGNLNLHLYDLVLMRPSVTITITQIKVKCLKSCLIVSSKYRIPLTHGLTLVRRGSVQLLVVYWTLTLSRSLLTLPLFPRLSPIQNKLRLSPSFTDTPPAACTHTSRLWSLHTAPLSLSKE